MKAALTLFSAHKRDIFDSRKQYNAVIYFQKHKITTTFRELGALDGRPLASPVDEAGRTARWNERYKKITRAIDFLLTIPAPDARPGPVGGGIIRHPLFAKHRRAHRAYDTVEELEKDINWQAEYGHRHRRSIIPRPCPKAILEKDLQFCPSELHGGNFIIVDKDESLCLLDFEHTGFLPLSFLAWLIAGGSQYYAQEEARLTCFLDMNGKTARAKRKPMIK
ncbi:MAG: hypothetical protein M1829_006925 [Trizodia sp. TS-e1964]|nr:MAG: hypothetical protein M1829_006925 [Trizodia sp. TS-e1964]